MLAKEHQCFYCAFFISGLRSDLSGRLRYPEADEFGTVQLFVRENKRCERERSKFDHHNIT